MKVSISRAAELAEVSRATFYSHIEKHSIQLEDADTARPKVPLSELHRVYGDKIQFGKKKEVSSLERKDTSVNEKIEVAALRAKVKHLEEVRDIEKRGYETHLNILLAVVGNAVPDLAKQLGAFLSPSGGAAIPARS